jgi:hypothetical protein
MAILVMCCNPSCGELMDTPESSVGKQFRCPACGTVQQVGAPGPQQHQKTPIVLQAQANTVAPASAEVSAPATPASSAPQAERVPPAKFAQAPREEFNLEPVELADEKHESSAGIPLLSEKYAAESASKSAPTDDVELIPAGPRKLTSLTEREKQKQLQQAGANQTANKVQQGSQSKQVVFGSILDNLPMAEIHQPVAITQDPAVLEHKLAGWMILIIGLVGMAVGLAIGLIFFDNKLPAAYIGSALGWMAGFTTAFLIVLNSDKGEDSRVRCPVCYNSHPPEASTCTWCGSALTDATINPMADGCLHAGSYALSNGLSIFWFALLAIAMTILLKGTDVLIQHRSDVLGQWQYALIALCAIVGLAVYGFLMQFFINATSQSSTLSRTAPDMPSLLAISNFGMAGKSLAVMALYVMPVFTLPLLPLALLRLAIPKLGNAMDIRAVAKSAWRYSKDVAILWLLLQLWLAALALATMLAFMFFSQVQTILPHFENDPLSQGVLDIVAWSVGLAVLGLAVCIFGLALFRCIGLFGRQHVAAMTKNSNKGQASN